MKVSQLYLFLIQRATTAMPYPSDMIIERQYKHEKEIIISNNFNHHYDIWLIYGRMWQWR